MATGLEGVAAKARRETKLQFTSLCHHINRELIWESRCNIPEDSAPGIDGVTVERTKKDYLENFFGSLDHGWLLRFVEHRVGDPRIPKLGAPSQQPRLSLPFVAMKGYAVL